MKWDEMAPFRRNLGPTPSSRGVLWRLPQATDRLEIMQARSIYSTILGVTLLSACATTTAATNTAETATTDTPEAVRPTDDKAVVERSLARMKKELEDAEARLETLEKKTAEKP